MVLFNGGGDVWKLDRIIGVEHYYFYMFWRMLDHSFLVSSYVGKICFFALGISLFPFLK